jgi:hypothetical protein
MTNDLLNKSVLEIQVQGKFNERYFDSIDAEEKAYWLGFIVADGCVIWSEEGGNYALSIGLQGGDVEHLRILERDLGGSRELREPSVNSRNGSVRLVWYSKYMAQSLINLGVTPRKSANEVVPVFPTHLARHFWRGVYDGDGCLAIQLVGPRKVPTYRFSLAGSVAVLQAFQAWAQVEVGVRPQKISLAANSQGVSRTSVFYMGGNRQLAAILGLLYENSTRKLQRKYALYLQLIEHNAQIRASFLRDYSGRAKAEAEDEEE